MKKVLNYIGQLRIYSLVDLCMLLVASNVDKQEFVGVLCLHVSFLAYLENRHAHNGRLPVPRYLSSALAILGLVFYPRVEGMIYLVCGFLYTKKNKGEWGMVAPIFRGMQYLFLMGGIAGYGSLLPWLAFFVITLRNALGDARDVQKDWRSGMATLPMFFLTKDKKYGHLIAVTVSTFVWWSFTGLPIYFLFGAVVVEVITYNWTPR